VLAEENVELIKEIEAKEAEIKALEQDNERLATAVDELWDRSTIKRVAAYNGISHKDIKWRPLKLMCERIGEEIYKVPDINYPEGVNVYSHDVWRLVYPELKLPKQQL
jgi:hypothetical protein